MQNPPEVLLLDEHSSCICSEPRTRYSGNHTFQERPCTIYTLTRAHKANIQLQACPSCPKQPRRFIGPDPRNIGIFNFNNQILVTHDLLDEYTSAFTSSETPFAAWIVTVSRRYDTHQSTVPFVSEKLFRSIWFAYSRLQRLDTDSLCPECGSDPQDTIWDGVTLAFSQKHMLPSLRPPTTLHQTSIQREQVRYRSGQQLIQPASLRKDLRFVIQGRSLAIMPDDEMPNEANNGDSRNKSKTNQQLVARVEAIPGVCSGLKAVNGALSVVFSNHYGVAGLLAGRDPPAVYRRLFVQVRWCQSGH
jgi:hypothetical protein